MKIPIEISARHVHVSQKDLEKLFGKGYKLHFLKKLSQTDDFSSKEEVELINKKNKMKVRVLGPCRKYTQAEVSITDSYLLKIKTPPIKISGELDNAPVIKIKGPKGTVKGKIIIAQRHLHVSEKQAKKLKLRNNQKIKVETSGKRAVIFENVAVRIKDDFKLALHLDTDEGNAAGITGKSSGKII